MRGATPDAYQKLMNRRRRNRRLAFGAALAVFLTVTSAQVYQQHRLNEQQARIEERIVALEQYNADLRAWRASMEQWETERRKEADARTELLLTLRDIQAQILRIDERMSHQ